MDEDKKSKQVSFKVEDVTLLQAVKILAETQSRVRMLEHNQKQILESMEQMLKDIKKIDTATMKAFKKRDEAMSGLMRIQKEIVKNTAPIVNDYNLHQEKVMEKLFDMADKAQKVDM